MISLRAAVSPYGALPAAALLVAESSSVAVFGAGSIEIE